MRVIDTRDVLQDGRAVLLLADADNQRASIFVGESRMLSGHVVHQIAVSPAEIGGSS